MRNFYIMVSTVFMMLATVCLRIAQDPTRITQPKPLNAKKDTIPAKV